MQKQRKPTPKNVQLIDDAENTKKANKQSISTKRKNLQKIF